MKLAAAAAGFTGTGAVENYHAAHAAHLNSTLVAGDNACFACPTCLTNPLSHAWLSKVVAHIGKIAPNYNYIY
jgi:hypothetical protein